MKNWKRYCSSIALGWAAATAGACGWVPTMNYHVFNLYENWEWNDVVGDIDTEWAAWSNGEIKTYDADAILKYARKTGDTAMERYMDLLKGYATTALAPDEWDSDPTSEYAVQLDSIRAAAEAAMEGRHAERFGLLTMRANAALERWEDNIELWEKRGKALPGSVYRDRMEAWYAQALVKESYMDSTDVKAYKAYDIYARLGDYRSINYCCSTVWADALEEIYNENPNNEAFGFLLQRYANTMQDIVEPFGSWSREEPIAEIRADMAKFIRLGERVLAEKKTQHPLLWIATKGWIEYLNGNTKAALKTLEKIDKTEGTEPERDLARMVNMTVAAVGYPKGEKADDFFARELQWLTERGDQERATTGERWGNRYDRIKIRLVYGPLDQRLEKEGRPYLALALAGTVERAEERAYNIENKARYPQYMVYFYADIKDRLTGADWERYIDLIGQKQSGNLEKWIAENTYNHKGWAHDRCGTRYLAEGKWAKAIEHLGKVPSEVVNASYVCGYLMTRDWTKEVWFEQQRNDAEELGVIGPGGFRKKVKFKEYPKLKFAREILALENEIAQKTGEERAQAAYRAATMLTQVGQIGDCWAITHDGKSSYFSRPEGELDFEAAAIKYLKIAQESKALTEKALYARAWIGLWVDPINRDGYYDEKSEKWVPRQTGRTLCEQYRALSDIRDYYQTHPMSEYAGRCDVIRRFLRDDL